MLNWNRIRIASLVLLASVICCAQQSTMDPHLQLLDRLAGNWVMEGTIAGKQTTHDLHADWVLNREYLRLHEISREKNADGKPSYEAIIFIEWNAKAQEYICLWLDSTSGGGLSAQGLAHGKPSGDSIPFIFSPSLRNTFTYDRRSDTWRWLIDDLANGKTEQFADLKLSRTPQRKS